MPCSARYLPAGLSFLMAPAGLMWSVVTESPSLSSTRAPEMSATGSGSSGMPSKYGGFRTYVESSSQANVLPSGVAGEHVGVVVGEHVGGDRSRDHVLDLRGRRPDVLHEHVVAVLVLTQRVVE